ncbi:putative UPF0481 protein At3g02645 [Humulus lupulus]|uniref:putative UPF0481 protein At3g02645 n=1 Tax=Humulus lupulus TaxID=3486 RepID=UPI002B40D3DE|nr:putative UPF0481 protein At3g02645 [Humulus lupulus]
MTEKNGEIHQAYDPEKLQTASESREEDEEKLDQLIKQGSTMTSTRHKNESDITKIQIVVDVMRKREEFKDWHKPKVLSIGPTHASDSGLSKYKDLKMTLAAKFLKESGSPWRRSFKLVKKKIIILKNFFDQDIISKYDDDSLAWLLFMDGCAVLEFIHIYCTSELEDLKISSGDAALIQEDLFLLENQIPYKLLELLMKTIKEDDDDDDDDDKKVGYSAAIFSIVLNNNVMGPIDYFHPQFFEMFERLVKKSEKNPKHLLHLLRSTLLDDDKSDDDERDDDENYHNDSNGDDEKDDDDENDNDDDDDDDNDDDDDDDADEGLKSVYEGLLKMLKDEQEYDTTNEMLEHMQQDNKMSFRNVQEIKSAGIKIRPSGRENMKFVSFSTRWFGISAYLNLPPINVDNTTACKLLNLVAYEMCLTDEKASPLVTSYVHLMDLLIDNEKDVKVLRKAGILRHRLSSDSEVARLFNNLGSNLVLGNEEDVFIEVKKQIDKHCVRRTPKWAAEFRRNHCKSPWALMSFILVLIAAFLTLKQFSSTIFPAGRRSSFNGIADLKKSY